MQVLADHVLPEIQPLKERHILLLIIRVNLEEIQLLGKRFRWKRPECCPGCRSRRIWGHGFTLRYFYGYKTGLWMKRWRCPDCYRVHTSRPSEYPVGSQYPIKTRLESVRAKIEGKVFLLNLPRQTQQYWKRAFEYQSRRHENWPSPVAFFQSYIVNSHRPISFRLKYRVIPSCNGPPYLNFAVTTQRHLNHL